MWGQAIARKPQTRAQATAAARAALMLVRTGAAAAAAGGRRQVTAAMRAASNCAHCKRCRAALMLQMM